MSSSNPKILFILPWFPYPLNSGGNQAMFNGIFAMRDSYDISVAYEAIDDDEYAQSERMFLNICPQVHLYPLLTPPPQKKPLKKRLLSKIKTLLKKVLFIKEGKSDRNPDNEELVCSSWVEFANPPEKKWQEHLSVVFSKNDFEIIQVEMMPMLSMVLLLPPASKKVFVHHEIGFVRRELEIQEMRPSSYVEACRTFAEINEVALLNKYDMVVSLSSIDAEKLSERGVNTAIMSSFAIVNTSSDESLQFGDGTKLVFVGPDSHKPNVVGITWFLENCWAELKRVDSNYSLTIVGEWNKQRISAIKDQYQDVFFLGFVDDLKGAIKGSVMIVPITIGSGIRMKILEAATNGTPFISTTVGAEGIPVENGKHCFITDDPQEFVEDIVKLKDAELQRLFVTNARSLVNSEYSLVQFKKNRMKIYDRLLE